MSDQLVKHQSEGWKKEAKECLQKLNEFGKMRREMYLSLVYLLHKIKKNSYYQFEGYTDFYVFCYEYTGYHRRSVLNFEYMHTYCEKFPELKQAILECPWASMLEIMKVIEAHNIQYWIDQAKEKTVKELKGMVESERKDVDVDKPMKWVADIYKDQEETIARAEIAYCQQEGISKEQLKKNMFLEHLCAEFLSGVEI